MKMIFGHIVDLLIWIVAIFSLSMIVIVSTKISNAGQFHQLVINRIESSYYSQEAIDECYEKADEYGYVLNVEEETVYIDRKDVKVSLTYNVSIPLFNTNNFETLIGYAR